jgi:O-antigen ligase
MSEHIRALLFIIILAFFSFFFSKKIVVPEISQEQFKRWRNAWFAVTTIAFLANNFWIYIVTAGIFVWFYAKKESNKLALFLAILFAVPMINQNISILGLDKLFSINYAKLLSLVILFPAYLAIRKMPNSPAFGKYWPDKILLIYMIYTVALILRSTSFTDMLREALYTYIGIFLPYYVASRGIKDLHQLKEVMIGYTLAGILAGTIAIFEFGRHWLLFTKLPDAWQISWVAGGYLIRSGSVRAMASLGQPIVLGYVMMLTLGFYLFVAKSIKSKTLFLFVLILILGGLYAPLSRGPWIGTLVLITIFIATGPKAFKHLALLGIALLLTLPLLGVIPGGQKIINQLPFIGNTETENIDYRKDLLDNSLIVFKNNPLFGSIDFRNDLANMGMTQGEGIVDIVNSYLEILLEYGLLGLSLFLGFFSIILLAMLKSIKKISDKKSQKYLFGRTLIASLISILVTIFTVSSISFIPIIYWIFAGLGMTYVRLAKEEESTIQSINTEPAAFPTSRLAIHS